MIPVPLIGGSYQSRSVISNAQRAVNYFPELNRRDSPFPMTHYQRPGLRPKASPGVPAPCRGLYQSSRGGGYTCIGDKIYYIDPSWNLVLLGSITALLTTPVSFTDNGSSIVVVDGSTSQWQIDLLTNAFALLPDPSGNFAGATRVDTLDTFIVWNRLRSNQWGATFSSLLTTDFFSRGVKATYPDWIVTLICRRTEAVLLGRLKGEIHYNTGGALFPFSRLPGAYIEYGCGAPYSVSAEGMNIFWLSQSLEGVWQVIGLKGYEAKPISNFAIANALQQMTDPSDAVGFCYQQNGHAFYQLSFGTDDQTWTYDSTIDDIELAWHQRAWSDINGILHRARDNCFAVINGLPCVGDWENGTIYQLDPSYYLDTVAGTDFSISFIRGFPQITQAYSGPQMQLEKAGGKAIKYNSFIADMDVGRAATIGGRSDEVGLRWSDDRGVSFGQTVLIPNGTPGQYGTNLKWPGLGIAAKERVFELSHSLQGQAALNGAWIDAVVTA